MERMRVMGFAETFKALSDPIRREILMMLRDGSMFWKKWHSRWVQQ